MEDVAGGLLPALKCS